MSPVVKRPGYKFWLLAIMLACATVLSACSSSSPDNAPLADDPETAPTTPGNLTYEVYSSHEIELFWNDSTDDGWVMGYDIFRDDMLLAEQLDANSFFEAMLEPNTTYQFQVVAVDDDGNRSPPADITLTTDGDTVTDTIGTTGSNVLFPASVSEADSHTVSASRTLDGIPLSNVRFGGWQFSLPVPDVDGDGRADYVFLAPAGLVSDCVAGVLLPSTMLPSAVLIEADLERSLRVVYGAGTDCKDVENITLIGDINGDDQEDFAVFVGATGAVVFGGLVSGLVDVLTLDGQNGFVLNYIQPQYYAGLYTGFASLGDLNADGFDDFVFRDLGMSAPAALRVIAGRASFPTNRSSGEISEGEELLSLQPQSVITAAGDMNGDGADDVIVGNRVIYGHTGLSAAAIDNGVELFRGECPRDAYYCSVRALGDVDADGFDDIVVSKLGYSGCGYGRRSAVLYGSSTGVITLDTLDDRLNPKMTRLVEGVANPCLSGAGFGAVGDLDNDGASDYGIYGATIDGIVFGRPGIRPAVVWLDDLDGSTGFHFNGSLRRGPLDVDGDGFDDLVFEDDTLFKGRERRLDVNGPTGFAVERGPAHMAASWQLSTLADAAGYRLELDDRLVTELDADVDEYVFDPLDDGAAELMLSVLSADGTVLGQSVRRIPAFKQLETLSVTIYGPRLAQISFPGDRTVRRYGRYLVWRDGVPFARAPDGAYDYVDATVEPGTTYRYFVTPDYLPQGSLDPANARDGPLLRRRSETIEVTTPVD